MCFPVNIGLFSYWNLAEDNLIMSYHVLMLCCSYCMSFLLSSSLFVIVSLVFIKHIISLIEWFPLKHSGHDSTFELRCYA